ncbi:MULTISPECIES: primosomal protein N' [unclassified Micromonospora]|uniref:primosomal protein N' n=1 Tax=unclassified Micromonospora TaxID=2617518 RepID=UPI001C23A897|nr:MULTISPECIES: primosomal protein N' [unclassified Micromonospora]MBU8860128.1 primosomal protein N' [Micromonospora sp. WMMB482]MDM4779659.1 primosomal protein N' [Micromonospora sp. b486]
MDVPLPHLDRPFDYLVPEALDADARPGVRVKVRFAGQLVDGWLLERAEASEHPKLAYLEKVVSPVPVLSPEVARLARAVADRYAGSLADVLRLAVPPRHARAEKAVTATDAPAADGNSADGTEPVAGTAPVGSSTSAAGTAPAGVPSEAADADARSGGRAGGPAEVDPRGWRDYPAGPALLRALTDGRSARAVWSALPGEDWADRYADAVAATVAGGRGALVVVADARDLDRLDAALTAVLGAGRHVRLTAADGPARRYRNFLTALTGDAEVVIGTRAAMFAPVRRLGLVAIWDDGDDLHAEPRAPYPHARDVLLTRAQLGDTAAVVGGYARTAEAQLLVETGWAREVVADRAVVRARTPAMAPTGDDPQLARDPGAASARLPSLAWTTARDALRADLPVLVQVPRRGYVPSVACADCRAPARCPHCAGPLALPSAQGTPACRWCGRVAAAYACPECGGRRLRASVTGARRTAEELGRAFPGVPVRTSGREEVLATVPGGAGLVIATPGAEPVADGGYGAVLLLDSWALLTRADLRAGEEALRRWTAAAALARPGTAGGRVVVVADGALAPVQALLRWDSAWFAARELAERRELGFPPAVRMASVTGASEAVADLLAGARLPGDAEVLGPVPADEGRERMLVRVPRSRAAAMAEALHAAAGQRSARKAVDPVRLQVDPLTLF